MDGEEGTNMNKRKEEKLFTKKTDLQLLENHCHGQRDGAVRKVKNWNL